MTTTHTATALSDAFVTLVRGALTPEQWDEMRRRNATALAGTCSSHDFIDANILMHEAFIAVVGHDPIPDEGEVADADIDLWNAAWSLAHLHLTLRD
jgi:hypothetical protein